VQEHIPGSVLTLMQARGHCPNLSAPAETVAAIRGFLATEGAAAQ
jgi:sigma-B regulation protein RsbQ